MNGLNFWYHSVSIKSFNHPPNILIAHTVPAGGIQPEVQPVGSFGMRANLQPCCRKERFESVFWADRRCHCRFAFHMPTALSSIYPSDFINFFNFQLESKDFDDSPAGEPGLLIQKPGSESARNQLRIDSEFRSH